MEQQLKFDEAAYLAALPGILVWNLARGTTQIREFPALTDDNLRGLAAAVRHRV